jgi:hypothetical protein
LTRVEVDAEGADVREDLSINELEQCVALHCASDTWHTVAVFFKVRSEKNVKVDLGNEALVPICVFRRSAEGHRQKTITITRSYLLFEHVVEHQV